MDHARYKPSYISWISFLLLAVLTLPTSCRKDSSPKEQPPKETAPVSVKPSFSSSAPSDPNRAHPRSDERLDERRRMVELIGDYYGLADEKVLEAMLNVPRHWFVTSAMQRSAYADRPLPIGYDQTISQPFIVAYMTSVLKLDESKKVLEIGTGSGYQAAVLSELTPYVYSIEIIEPLGLAAKEKLSEKGYSTIKLKIGDGYKGWSEYQPFDAIIVTCAPEAVPSALIEQLAPEGKIIIPVGRTYSVQQLVLLTKDKDGKIMKKSLMPVRFVPMLRED
jgi:protein-L-isoaspartate(D-aspartate) O-methyltransferase